MEEKDYKKFQWKIIAATLAFALIPLFVLGVTMHYQFTGSYATKVYESLKTLSENRRDAVDLFLEERVSQLYTLAYTHSFNDVKQDEVLGRIFTLVQTRAKSFVDFGIIDKDGNHVAYVGPYQLTGVNYKNEEWFNEVKLRGVYVSDVFMGFRKFPHFIIAVMRREGDTFWILRATIDTEIFEAMVKAAQVGRKGDAFLVNRAGILQTTPRFHGELLGQTPYTGVSKFAGTKVDETELSGEKTLVASTWLKNKDWLLLVYEDPQENMSAILRAQTLAIAIVVGGILLIVAGAVLVARLMIGQLIQRDREKAMLDASLIQSGKMAALGKLAAGIAHEVNNPLAVIKEKVGWIRDLLSEEEITQSENFKEFDDAVRKIDYHVDRAKKVTHRLLGFARRMEPIQEEVTVNRVIEETVEFLRNEAHYRTIEIRTDFGEGIPQIMSDSAQLQQVFLNILNNAIDAVGKDGVISITTRHRSPEQEIAISIADNGPGISNENLNKIFDPFFTTKEVGRGTGLGLSISYSIIEKLGGRIMVASKLGEGTTFTIHLPVLNAETSRMTSSQRTDASRPPAKVA